MNSMVSKSVMINKVWLCFTVCFAIHFEVIFSPLSIAHAALVKKDVDYSAAGRPYLGYLVYDDRLKANTPGVLIAHNWMGITDETKSKADQVASLGYVVFAVDVYGKDRRPKNMDEAKQLSSSFKKDRVLLRGHMQEGLAQLKKAIHVDKSRLAAIGYCFGGTAAIELARAGADLKGVVSFHGGLDSPTPDDGKKIKGRLIAFHGADDPFVPAANLTAFEEEMRKWKIDWQLVKYGGAVHSFTEKAAGNDNSKGAAYNASADQRSWLALQGFLKETL